MRKGNVGLVYVEGAERKMTAAGLTSNGIQVNKVPTCQWTTWRQGRAYPETLWNPLKPAGTLTSWKRWNASRKPSAYRSRTS